jgi:putative transposase
MEFCKKKLRCVESQIIDALKSVEVGLDVSDLYREQRVSMAAFYKWISSKAGGASMMARMKELEEENRRLNHK